MKFLGPGKITPAVSNDRGREVGEVGRSGRIGGREGGRLTPLAAFYPGPNFFSICTLKFVLENVEQKYKICTKEERLYTIIQHLLLFRAKKYGPGWVDGWVGGRAGLRIAYSNQKQNKSKSLLL